MKKLPIDKMLQWTVRDELPKGRPVSASPWDVLMSYSRLGARVDVSGGGDGLGMVPGTPHPDAVKIGEALNDLPAEAHIGIEDCEAWLGHWSALAQDDIAAYAGKIATNLQALLIKAAILSPPEWNIGTPRLKPWKRTASGTSVVHVLRDGQAVEERAHPKHGGFQHVAHLEPRSFVTWDDPSLGLLLSARAQYALWHKGLEMLAAGVAGNLSEHEALPPDAPPRPWVTGAPKPSRVLRSKPERMAKLPLGPTRERALPPVKYDPRESGAQKLESLDGTAF